MEFEALLQELLTERVFGAGERSFFFLKYTTNANNM
jgi:hypothetical protein